MPPPPCFGSGGILRPKENPTDSDQAYPAARANFCLVLLPSGPDTIRSMTPHGTRSSSPVEQRIVYHKARKNASAFSARAAHPRKMAKGGAVQARSPCLTAPVRGPARRSRRWARYIRCARDQAPCPPSRSSGSRPRRWRRRRQAGRSRCRRWCRHCLLHPWR